MSVIEIPTVAVVTVPNVPICATGIEYPLSTGPATFTPEDLADAVASQDDPAIRSPRNGIGHIDPRYNGPQFDGEPAWGVYKNLRLAENGQLLVADIVGVPVWLADLMPIAYPNRSIEGHMEVETVTGHKWRLVIEAVKLLGILWPGVSVLEDLPLYFGKDVPPDVKIVEQEGEDVSGAKLAAARGRQVEASVNVDDVRRQYYDGLDANQMWWWIRAMYLEPNELIVEDDEGSLYRVAFGVRGEDITFDDPVEVRIQYVNAGRGAARERALALVASSGRQIAEFDSRAASRPDNAAEQEEGTVNPVILRSLRAHHGLSDEELPDDATEEQIAAAIAASTGEPPAEEPAEGDRDRNDEPEPEGEPEEEPEGARPAEEARVPVAAAAPGMISVPADQWARTQRDLQRVTARADEDERVARSRIIDDAIRAGKIRPVDRQSYVNGLENPATRQQFTTLLTASVEQGGLAENIVPVRERGGDAPPESMAPGAAYDESWLSDAERARVAAAREGTLRHDRIVVEGERTAA